MSVAGGLYKSVDRAESVDSEALQIFTKNQRQWKAKPLDEDVARAFIDRVDASKIKCVVSHDSYLINLASPKDDLWEKSIAAYRDELERCERLKIPYLVAHPGAHTGSGREAGIDRIVQAIDRVNRELPDFDVMTLLETTAGQGTSIGGTFEDLSELLNQVESPERVGVCFDTCHTFVAGYDCRTPESYSETMVSFDELVGVENLRVFHFNDSKGELGSHLDRHDLIGQGKIGIEGFRSFMNDARFDGIPALLETEKGEELEEDRKAIELLRSLVEQS